MAETTPAPNNITVKFGGKPEREANFSRLDQMVKQGLISAKEATRISAKHKKYRKK